jgi:hypothetical protein
MLCHDALEKLIMQDTKVVDELAIEEITAQEVS